MRRLAAVCLALLVGASTTRAADVITDWNEVLLDTIRAVGGAPGPLSRTCAMTHVAIFEAINSIDRAYEPYIAYIPVTRPANKRAAAAQAAHDVLVFLYPARASIYDQALTSAQLATSFALGPSPAFLLPPDAQDATEAP